MIASAHRLLSWIDRQLGRIAGLFAIAGSIGVTLLMVIILIAVFWRYVLNDPLFGIDDISVMVLAVVAACAVAYGARNDSQVSVNIITRFFGRGATRYTDVLMRVMALGITGLAAYALSGSSLAAALTMGRVSLPEMQRYKYDDGLATGAIAAGGTLGILIPPSAGFVIYAILNEESIGRLFLAGVFPGILLTHLFIVAIVNVVTRDPSRAPQSAEAVPLGERVRALGRASWIIGIIVLTIGGIYTGVFSGVEAAGVGAALAFIVTVIRRAVTWSNMVHVFTSTLKASGTLFMILFGAFVFKTFVGFTGVTFILSEWVADQGFSGMEIVIAFLIMFIILGTFMEGFAILVLTVPLIQPIIEPLGINMIWFEVMMVIVLEMGLISPPVGINVFVVKGVADGVPLNTIFRGIWPFWFAMLACVILLVPFPEIALILPNTMFG